jgi:hypothetical protein
MLTGGSEEVTLDWLDAERERLRAGGPFDEADAARDWDRRRWRLLRLGSENGTTVPRASHCVVCRLEESCQPYCVVL